MKKILFGLLVVGLTTQAFSQVIKTEELSEVVVMATNYKYLSDVDSKEAPVDAKLLERMVASFDVKDSEFYQDEYDLYNVTFFIPDGKILAAYDKDGKVLRTVEKFKDINVPEVVRNSVYKRFPGWMISKDVYLVNYHQEKGANRRYKLKLVNGDKTLRVKTDEDGNFL
ncbi:hypothetical protein GGR42_000859 [Saonia flava]|uniref:Nicotinate-nucleotide adenylyltransferase n=1 Tax=Saonia flava TaxID=523696 RepID=A0A846QT52_9FLAO|nr:nicotinate-nucleotide adenylyltransferase [Saonia flava]NJB70397.1 hypothetical protein [Saonia flava]